MFPISRSGQGDIAGLLTTLFLAALANVAAAQNAYYAGIAYSQSTGKIGSTSRQARTEEQAKELAALNCGAPDAKTYIWGPNQWVAIAVVEGAKGIAGFGRGASSDEAQRKALAECAKRAKGQACQVALCLHSQGMRPRTLMSVPRDPNLPPPAPKSGFFAAIAYSPSTGKIGYTAGRARTKEEAQARAVKNCGAPDAKAYMWGDGWVAIAIAEGRRGTAGFGPGATREAAEQAAMAQCRKSGNGAPCRVAFSVHSSGEQPSSQVAKAAASPTTQPGVTPQTAAVAPRPDNAVTPAAAQADSQPAATPAK